MNKLVVTNNPKPNADGYTEAFYELAAMMGLDYAQPLSPKEVWETQMRPRLARALANQEKK